MAATLPLLGVSRALPGSIQAITPVLHLIDAFLLPTTIDAAVYLDLELVLKRYGRFLPYTVKAMDGAATKGRLDIVQKLHETRTEGCSAAAFTGAAINNRLAVFTWLTEHYPTLCYPQECLFIAAAHDSVEVVKYLRLIRSRSHTEEALEVAAAEGYTRTVEALLPGPHDMSRPYVAAAVNGRIEVLQLFVERGFVGSSRALQKAAEVGCIEGVEFLLPKCDDRSAKLALHCAASSGRLDVVQLLLEKREFDDHEVSLAFAAAARNDRFEVVKFFVERYPPRDDADVRGGDQLSRTGRVQQYFIDQHVIGSEVRSAINRGSIGTMKLLMECYQADLFPDDLRLAVLRGRADVVKLLLDICEAKGVAESRVDNSISATMFDVVSRGYFTIAELFVVKCTAFSASSALTVAVEQYNCGMVKVFAAKSGKRKVHAFVQAASRGKIEIVEILLQFSDQETIEKVLMRLPSQVDSKVLTLILDKCESGAWPRIFVYGASKGVVRLVQQLLGQMETKIIRCALMIATANGKVEVVAVLLEKCDIVSIECAIEVAVTQNHASIEEMLRGRSHGLSVNNSAGTSRTADNVSCKKARLV